MLLFSDKIFLGVEHTSLGPSYLVFFFQPFSEYASKMKFKSIRFKMLHFYWKMVKII